MVFKMEFSIKIMYMEHNGVIQTDTSTLFYQFNSNISTKNAFNTISDKLKEQLNLNKNEYTFIYYDDGLLIPFDTENDEIIYTKFNRQHSVPFYIQIITTTSYYSMMNYLIQECPICMNRIGRSHMISPYRCGHSICNNCYQRCIQTNHLSCCYCRESNPSNTIRTTS
jgi:hypothetical protein